MIYDMTKKNEFDWFMKAAMEVNNPDRICGVINYELTFRRNVLKTLTGFTLMLDESSLIQNENAKRSKFILGLKPDNVILLSAPTGGKYEKLWSQCQLLGGRFQKNCSGSSTFKRNGLKPMDFGGNRLPAIRMLTG
jgi:hypothetical protein